MMEVLSVIRHPRQPVFLAAQEVDGILIHLKFPIDTLEWRAAEYQIEPTETDLLMDIVLYERFLEQQPGEVPDLWSAPSIDEARARHVARVMEAKERQRPNGPRAWKNKAQRLDRFAEAGMVDRQWLGSVLEGDALVPIREGHAMDLPVLFEKAKLVDQQRQQSKRSQAFALFGEPAALPPASERAARIRHTRTLGEQL